MVVNGITVVVREGRVMALTNMIVGDLPPQSDGVNVQAHPYALFVTGRGIRPIAVSLTQIAPRTGVNRQQKR